MNKKLIRSSVVAVTGADRPNQYLLYRDNGWGCDFFPNRRTNDDYETDRANMAEYLTREYDVDVDPENLRLVGTNTNSKLSTEHNEVREYEYRLYLLSTNVRIGFPQEKRWSSNVPHLFDWWFRMVSHIAGMMRFARSDTRIGCRLECDRVLSG